MYNKAALFLIIFFSYQTAPSMYLVHASQKAGRTMVPIIGIDVQPKLQPFFDRKIEQHRSTRLVNTIKVNGMQHKMCALDNPITLSCILRQQERFLGVCSGKEQIDPRAKWNIVFILNSYTTLSLYLEHHLILFDKDGKLMPNPALERGNTEYLSDFFGSFSQIKHNAAVCAYFAQIPFKQ